MKKSRAMFVGLLLAYCSAVAAQQPGEAPVIAESSGVEISAIQIVRRKASYQSPQADLTNMEVQLWFSNKWSERYDRFLIKITDLSQVTDNTGKVLSTKERLGQLDCFQCLWLSDNTRTLRGLGGPQVLFVLDAPERKATSIKSLKGTAEVSRTKYVPLDFDNLPSLVGKPLQHPQLSGLQLIPTLETVRGDTHVTLQTPKTDGRLVAFALLVDGKEPRSFAESKQGKSETKYYAGDHSQKASLRLILALPIETKRFDFNFQNIELP